MLAEICTAMLGTTALMSFIEFAKLTRSGKPRNQPPYYFRDLFRDYQRPRLSLRTWHLRELAPRVLSTSVLAVLGEGCQARPELNSSGLFFFDLSFTDCAWLFGWIIARQYNPLARQSPSGLPFEPSRIALRMNNIIPPDSRPKNQKRWERIHGPHSLGPMVPQAYNLVTRLC